MRLQDWLTLLAIVVGPLVAVLITFVMEGRRRTMSNRLRIVRMLLATRHLPAHPDYNAAVNLIPAEFNDQPKVMEAWRRYLDLVREYPSVEHQPDHQKRVDAAQSKLILEGMLSAGLDLSEGDIQTLAYASKGFVDRDMIYIKSLQAMTEIAEALKKQNKLTEQPIPPPAPLKRAS
jgi:hypothetical protein